MADGEAAADIEQARLKTGFCHGVEQAARLLQGHAPVLRVAALRAYVERDTGKIRAQLCRGGDDLPRVGGAGAELARHRPVAAAVRPGDPKVLFSPALYPAHP